MKPASKLIFAFSILAITGCVLSIQPAAAHHSFAGFDTKVIEIKGTIKEFQFKNPHTWIQVMVDDAKGEKMEWSLEWGAPNQLSRQGIRPSTFPAGAQVTARLRPMTNGNPAGAFVGLKFADGRTVGQWAE